MVYFLLFIFAYGIKAAENRFTLILADKDDKQHEIVLNTQDLKFFALLDQSCKIPNNQNDPYKCNNELISYESFVQVFQPLSKINFKEKRPHLMPEEIRVSSALFEDTKNVLEWIEQNKPDVQILIKAYAGANFLQLPFAVKRGIVNYLYDYNIANKLIEQSDLAENSSEWLISNRGYDPLSGWLSSDKKNYPFVLKDYYTIVDYSNKWFRFLDIREALEKAAGYFSGKVHYYFDFKNNQIQNINIFEFKNSLKLLPKHDQYKTVFDFTNNPLSQTTKDNIIMHGKEQAIPNFAIEYLKDLESTKTNKLKDIEIQKSAKFKFYAGLMSFTAFYGTYLISSKIFLQSMRKSLTHGLGALFFVSPLILYLYKNKDKILTSTSSYQQIEYLKDQIRKNEALLKTAQDNDASSSIKTFLIGNLFYIRYTDTQ